MLEAKLTQEAKALIKAMTEYKPFSSRTDEDQERIKMANKVQYAWQQYYSKNGDMHSIAAFFLANKEYF